MAAEQIRLDATADVSICAHETERELNTGASGRLKLKGTENIILLDFDSSRLGGRKITSAVLWMKGAADDLMVRRIGVSTVVVPWSEGAKENGTAGEADSCFLKPGVSGETGWNGPGRDLTYAVFGRAGTIWGTFEAERKEAWYLVSIDPKLVEACAAGLSFGLAVSDDNGQTMNIAEEVWPGTNHGNNIFLSRESGEGPYVVVSTEQAPKIRPARLNVSVKARPVVADFENGGVGISWTGPGAKAREAILGYRVKFTGARPVDGWLKPSVPPAGERARWLTRMSRPGGKLSVEVEAVGRGGVVMARGTGRGTISRARARTKPLRVVPFAPPAGEPLDMGFARVWAVPDCVKVNPMTGNTLEDSGIHYPEIKHGAYRRSNPAWDGKRQVVVLGALRGEWVAFQLVVENGSDSPAAFGISAGPLKGPGGSRISSGEFRLYRAWYQRIGARGVEWYADPLVPLGSGGGFWIPDPQNAVPGQRNQVVYIELFVPRNARAGDYSGAFILSSGGKELSIPVELSVGKAVIPEETAFTWSLNAYSSPGNDFGPVGSREFLEAEKAFYAMAHEHRATLAILHYSHSGSLTEGCVPAVSGRGKEMRVGDWEAWDERFGPLFDGSAFAGTKRPGVSLDHFYLALSESYPTTMAQGYKWNDLTWEEHWLKAGTVEEGFSPEFKAQWKAVAADYLRHIRNKGWKTRFMVYLNDKYFYKQYDRKKKARGGGASFWLLDEPMHMDDFRALAFFGGMLREVQGGDRKRIIYRVDLSRPEWGRDTLDRVMDVDISGGAARYRELLDGWRDTYGHGAWTYGDLPRAQQSALGLVAQALDIYSRGLDGYVPWLVLGTEENWREFATTCILYPGKPFGITGPCPSLRLKAMRRGEQDVCYVRLLAEKKGLLKDDPGRLNVAELLRAGPRSERTEGQIDPDGALTEFYSGLDPAEFEDLRRAVSAALSR